MYCLFPIHVFLGEDLDYQIQKEREWVEKTFKLTNARKGKAAVKEAIDFFLQQKNQRNYIQSKNKSAEASNQLNTCFGRSCQTCNVTFESILNEGSFKYLGDKVQEPYSHRCWSMRIRYHTAPKCLDEEAERGIIPIYRWKFQLRSAGQGLCRMPNPSPVRAIMKYAESQGIKTFNRPFTVLMLGLSFMGQPFQSLGCQYESLLSGGTAFVDWLGVPNTDISEIRRDGGQCTGYELKEISSYYPKDLHPDVELPTQNLAVCSMDSALMKFKEEGKLEVHVCYTYVFNVPQNFPPGSKLPCGLQWKQVDIVLSIPQEYEMLDLYIPHTGGDINSLENLKVIFVGRIYEGLIEARLDEAYKEMGFPSPTSSDFRAKFAECGQTSDIHYRLPGIPDIATSIWFSLISSGLNEGYKTKGKIKYWV